MRSLIGITAGEIRNLKEPWSPVTYGQSHTYIDAVIHAGGIPVIIPLTTDESVLKEVYARLDGILLSGGNDVNPELYNQLESKKTEHVSKFRDGVETSLIKWAMADNKPVLAICRGMQMLNVTLGGSLHQHVLNSFPEAQDHTSSSVAKNVEDLAHILKIEPKSKLASIVGAEPINANTHHHQSVDKLGNGLVATAWAEDGIVEAIEDSGKKFLIGVQCHPESLEQRAETRWQKLFAEFVSASKS